ncbi:MAG: hypothetical protein F6K11_18140, partial [Leptolyngbya sp. SIO3F4]|nr:hypothetical protein [Leptolyngbya sp. SIO3F4]
MTFSASARQLRVLIGGQDWSDAVNLLSVNYTSLEDSSNRGQIQVEATLELTNAYGLPESTNPRTNPVRWKVGQNVYIQVRNSTNTAFIDTWFSRLFIVAEPSAPSLPDSILSIELGCLLRWHTSFQLDRDASGITLGTAENSSAVASRLLQASDIVPSNISLNSWEYSLDYPFGKDTNSFAEQAGELAWCNDGRILYQNVAGSITDKQLSLTPNSEITTVTIGTNDIVWQPLPDPQQPPETTKCAGAGQDLSTLSNPDVNVVPTTGDFSDYVPGAVGSGTIRRVTTTKSFSPGAPNTVPVTPPTKTTRVQVEELPAMIFQDASDVSPSLAVTDFTDTTQVKTYESGFDNPIGQAKLLSIVTTKEQRGKSLLDSDGLANMREVEITSAVRTHDTTSEFITQLVTTSQQAEILLDETTTNPWNLRDIKVETTNWIEISKAVYEEATVNADAVISLRSNVDKTNQNIWAFQVSSSEKTASSENKPPAVEFYDGGTNAAEVHYEGEAYFTDRKKRHAPEKG